MFSKKFFSLKFFNNVAARSDFESIEGVQSNAMGKGNSSQLIAILEAYHCFPDMTETSIRTCE
jgi:hypothetical protein